MIKFCNNIAQFSRFLEKRITHPNPETGSFILDGGNVKGSLEGEGSSAQAAAGRFGSGRAQVILTGQSS